MSHRTKAINGVKHAPRCCCPVCDPRDLVATELRRVRVGPVSVAAVAGARYAARSYRPQPQRSGTDETRRFRQLLAEGLTAAEAIAKLEAEKKGNP